MPIAAAIPAIIGGVTSIAGGVLGSGAASKASGQQVASLQQLMQLAGNTTNQGNTTLANAYNPYLALGQQGATSLSAAMQPGGSLAQTFSFDPNSFAQNPDYQFTLNQGMKALQQSAAARGALGSGTTLQAAMRFGQGLANTYYNQAYDRALNTYQTNRNNTLQGLSLLTGIGQNAANSFASGSLNNLWQGANLQGQAITGTGNAQAAGTIGSANAWSNALSGIGGAVGGYATNRTLNSIFNSGIVNSMPGASDVPPGTFDLAGAFASGYPN